MTLSEEKDSDTVESQKMAETEAIMKRRALILDSLNLIPIFTGQDLTWNFEQFKCKFSALAEFLKWPEEDQLFAIQQRLAGLALQTFVIFKDNINSVSDLFKVFEEKFGAKRDQGDILNEFWSFKQQHDMSVSEYLVKASRKADMAIKSHELPVECEEKTKQQWLMSMLVKNLLPHIRKGVIARNPADLKNLEEIALLEERAYKSVPVETSEENLSLAAAITSNTKKPLHTDKDTDFKGFVNDLKEQLTEIHKKINNLENADRENKKIICNWCLRSGHIQRFCPDKRKEDRYYSRDTYQRNANNREWGFERKSRGQRYHMQGTREDSGYFRDRNCSRDYNRDTPRERYRINSGGSLPKRSDEPRNDKRVSFREDSLNHRTNATGRERGFYRSNNGRDYVRRDSNRNLNE